MRFLRNLGFGLLFTAFFATSAHASVPEPSLIVYGQVFASDVPAHDASVVVSAKRGETVIAESGLNPDKDYEYSLEILLEAAIGERGLGKVRIGDVLSLCVNGILISSFQVTERGLLRQEHLSFTGQIDSDGDGIADNVELSNQSNPYDPNDPVMFGNLDADGDGIANGSEYLLGTYDPDGDQDIDGFSNGDEYVKNTNPNSISSFPFNKRVQGTLNPILLVDSANAQKLLINTAPENEPPQLNPFEWNESALGVPVSMTLLHWDLDESLDLMISTSSGMIYVLLIDQQTRLVKQQLPIVLTGLPADTDISLGYTDINGDGIWELWTYQKAAGELKIYHRKAGAVPFGSVSPDMSVNVGSNLILELVDVTNDGIVDLLSVEALGAIQSIVLREGNWGGLTLSFNTGNLWQETGNADISKLIGLNNIGEVGFDAANDVLFFGNNCWQADLAVSLYASPAIGTTYSLKSVVEDHNTETGSNELVDLFSAAQLKTYAECSAQAPVGIADLNNDGLLDMLRYMDDGVNGYFILPVGYPYLGGDPDLNQVGVGNNEDIGQDLDSDGIFDVRDPSPLNANIPLPNGDSDFDNDGIPYAVDPDKSGSEDFDSDGIPDGFEIVKGLNPSSNLDRDTDPDLDGFNNLQEYLNGTEPLIPDAPDTGAITVQLEINAFGVEGGDVSDIILLDQLLITSSHQSTTVKVWNRTTGQLVSSLLTLSSNGVNALEMYNNTLIVGTIEGDVEIWDLENVVRLERFRDGKDSVMHMDVYGDTLYIAFADGYVYSWDLITNSYIERWLETDGFVSYVEVTADKIITQSTQTEDKQITIRKKSDGSLFYGIKGGNECCKLAVTAGDSQNLALVQHFDSNNIHLLNIEDATNRIVSAATGEVTSMALSGSKLFVADVNGVISQIDTNGVQDTVNVTLVGDHAVSLRVNNTNLVSGHVSGKAYIWSVANVQ